MSEAYSIYILALLLLLTGARDDQRWS